MESFINSCQAYFESHSSSVESFKSSSKASFEEEKSLFSQMEELIKKLKKNQKGRSQEVEQFIENQTTSRNLLVTVTNEKSQELRDTYGKMSEGNAQVQNEVENMNSTIPTFVSHSVRATQEVVSNAAGNLNTVSSAYSLWTLRMGFIFNFLAL